MTGHGPAQFLGRHLAVRVMFSGAVVLGGIVSAFAFGGYRINTTPSFPLGLWQIAPLQHEARAGDTVFICVPPDSPALKLGLDRGYLPRGLCPGHLAPLIKTVVATAGQTIAITNGQVFIDSVPLAYSAVLASDGAGRPMKPCTGGTVPVGSVFLHSNYIASYDSRYFGPVPVKGVLGLAKPVLTFAP